MSIQDLMLLNTLDDRLLALAGFCYLLFILFCVFALAYGLINKIWNQ